MKILVLDSSQAHAQEICKTLDVQGHSPLSVKSWKEAVENVRKEEYPILLIDHAFLSEIDNNISSLRRASRGDTYVIGMGVPSMENIIRMGYNRILSRQDSLEDVIQAASLFILKLNQFANREKNFPSAGGIISKSAFNQLLLSSMDLVQRDGKMGHVLLFSIDNYKEIAVKENDHAARHATARLAHHLSQTRRQSDILAQIDDNEYALLFLRPEYEEEPLEATNRFATTLADIKDYTTGMNPVNITLRLYGLPSGQIQREHSFTAQGKSA